MSHNVLAVYDVLGAGTSKNNGNPFLPPIIFAGAQNVPFGCLAYKILYHYFVFTAMPFTEAKQPNKVLRGNERPKGATDLAKPGLSRRTGGVT